MGIPSEMRNTWLNKRRESLWITSPAEEEKIRRSRECTREGVRAGAKAAAIACVASAIPTLTAVRTIPWAKANLNYTAQALIISGASIAAYFITADKTILECARRNTQYDKSA
ncbi:early nodulin-93 [Coffea eugenioides]|uniref:Early nodulin-93-like n=1 Tax=Coffea arabica TaxID=13443 RepID=A0A6P6TW54_COFAR|nr:early nodulin-93-like [Coffea arabica]XP_027081952.1 early nodulin-93-like [Coffea arabica]XP_027081953.1 early nodulin-93-like [Coffea arabica]XP_027181190.1 early nodulin-93 [Coffea eugenioides]XP_027181191.1 early nodulin-93 [Coffea eugenioides]